MQCLGIGIMFSGQIINEVCYFFRLSMGWNEVPNPLFTVGGEAALNTSASMSTNGAAFWEVDVVEGDVNPSRSVLWLLVLCVEWFPTEFKAGLLRSLGVVPSLPGAPGSATRPGFFFFSIANIDDSRSGNGGISSKTVACDDWQMMIAAWTCQFSTVCEQ